MSQNGSITKKQQKFQKFKGELETLLKKDGTMNEYENGKQVMTSLSNFLYKNADYFQHFVDICINPDSSPSRKQGIKLIYNIILIKMYIYRFFFNKKVN